VGKLNENHKELKVSRWVHSSVNIFSFKLHISFYFVIRICPRTLQQSS